MSTLAKDLVQSRNDSAVSESTLRELAEALIAAGIADERLGL
jgi:hypothetical protein